MQSVVIIVRGDAKPDVRDAVAFAISNLLHGLGLVVYTQPLDNANVSSKPLGKLALAADKGIAVDILVSEKP